MECLSEEVSERLAAQQQEVNQLRASIEARGGLPAANISELQKMVQEINAATASNKQQRACLGARLSELRGSAERSGSEGRAVRKTLRPSNSPVVTPRTELDVGQMRSELESQKVLVGRQLQQMEARIEALQDEVGACFEGLEALRGLNCSRVEFAELRRALTEQLAQDVLPPEDLDKVHKHDLKFNGALRFWKRRDTATTATAMASFPASRAVTPNATPSRVFPGLISCLNQS